jgi:hypothetical protein
MGDVVVGVFDVEDKSRVPKDPSTVTFVEQPTETSNRPTITFHHLRVIRSSHIGAKAISTLL